MQRVSEIILVLTMLGTTLTFGGVQPLSYSLMEIALYLALLLILVEQTRQGEIRLHLPIWPVLFAVLVAMQMIPLPAGWVAKAFPIRALNRDLGGLWPGGWNWATFSIYPHETEVMLLKFLAYLAAFLLAASLFDSRRGKSLLVGALIFIGALEAAYGIVQYTTGWQQVWTYTRETFAEEASGTFINRNHFAGLLELTIPFAIAMAFYSFQEMRDRGTSQTSIHAKRGGRVGASFQAIFYLFLTVMMLIALVFSRSRGGILTMAIVLVFLALLGYVRLQEKLWTLVILFLLVSVTGYGLWVGLGPVLSRFEALPGTSALTGEGRVSLFQDEIRLIRDHPILGTGLGTFGIVIHSYQTVSVNEEIVHAHNDYFEAASDTGLAGAALLFVPVFYLFLKSTSFFLDDPRRLRRSLTLGCVGSMMAIFIHSAFDFNLQIPSNALIFAVVLGISYKITRIERAKGGAESWGEARDTVAAPGAQNWM